MKNVPTHERPRERLLHLGGDSLGLHELIAILISSGTKEKPVLELAADLIFQFRGIEGLIDASVEELMRIKGLGPAKAIQLKAAFTLAKKVLERRDTNYQQVRSARDAYELLKPHYVYEKREKVLLMLRDVRGRVFQIDIVGIGILTEVLVHPREIFHMAVRRQASSIILAHNHPSGSPEPSDHDDAMTQVVMHAGKIMGIPLDDHIILGEGSYYSYREDFKLEDREPVLPSHSMCTY